MERIDRPEALARLAQGQLRRGVFTNHFLAPADVPGEIARGLRAEPFDGGLWILRRRGGHDLLTFYLQPGASPPPPALERPTVTEVPWRPRDEAAAAAALDCRAVLGFREQFRRRRRERPADTPPEAPGVRAAGPEALTAAADFLARHFDPLTGCLPDEAALADALAAGQVLVTEDGAGLTGLLHFTAGRGAAELRHLAVRADARGRGLGRQLVGGFLARTAGLRRQVWARAGNAAAEHLYETNGFRPDGWRSAVLLAGERTDNP